jgi:hypothetical protein
MPIMSAPAAHALFNATAQTLEAMAGQYDAVPGGGDMAVRLSELATYATIEAEVRRHPESRAWALIVRKDADLDRHAAYCELLSAGRAVCELGQDPVEAALRRAWVMPDDPFLNQLTDRLRAVANANGGRHGQRGGAQAPRPSATLGSKPRKRVRLGHD